MHDLDLPTVVMVRESPMPFRGGVGEAEKNYNTHLFVSSDPFDDEPRCARCDVGPWMTSANWPCGAEVLRRRVMQLSDNSIVYDNEYLPGKWVSELNDEPLYTNPFDEGVDF